jgi:hypothetical protein
VTIRIVRPNLIARHISAGTYLSVTQDQIEKLKMDGISTIETEKKISTIKMLEAYGKESKNEVIDAITGIIDSSPRTEVVKAGHDSIQRIKG